MSLLGEKHHQTHNQERQRGDRRPEQQERMPASSSSSSSSSRRQKRKSGVRGRTIPSLLRYMEGLEVVAELKTGRRIQGILVVAEDDMNITLEVSSSSSPSFVTKQPEERGRPSSETKPTTASSDGKIHACSQKTELGTHDNVRNSNVIFDIHRGGFLDHGTEGDDDDESDRGPTSAAAAAASGATPSPSSSVENNNIKDNKTANVHIRGSEIRYIQFPDNVQPSRIVSVGLERERLAAKKYQKTMRR